MKCTATLSRNVCKYDEGETTCRSQHLRFLSSSLKSCFFLYVDFFCALFSRWCNFLVFFLKKNLVSFPVFDPISAERVIAGHVARSS